MRNMKLRGPDLARLAAAVLLLWALADHPYGYYTMLRWVVSGVAAWTAFEARGAGSRGLAWLFGIAALMFNPIVPVHLDRQTWAWIDVVQAIAFIAVSLTFVANPKQAWKRAETVGRE